MIRLLSLCGKTALLCFFSLMFFSRPLAAQTAPQVRLVTSALPDDSCRYRVMITGGAGFQADSLAFKLGTSYGSDNLNAFTTGTFIPQVEDFKRSGNRFLIGLGSYPRQDSLFLEMKTREQSGSWSAPIEITHYKSSSYE